MARRPVFIPDVKSRGLVREVFIEFEWFPGFAVSQKQKSIISLHKNAIQLLDINQLLEISTKSPESLGVDLSAFNLDLELKGGNRITVESAYQGGKVFAEGGPYVDLYQVPSNEVKKDERLVSSGDLKFFLFDDQVWKLEPKTAFYNWLYIKGLMDNPHLSGSLHNFDGFTDIEFNPKKSINCQARAAALFVSLSQQGILKQVMARKENFIESIWGNKESGMQLDLPGL